MNTAARRLLALLVAVPVVVAGCTSSTSGNGKSSSTPTSPSTTASAPSSSAPASTPASETVTKAEATAALLAPADVGAGFTKAAFQASTTLPCTPKDPPLEQQVPSTLQVGGAAISESQQAAVSEDLRFYPDVATAQRVLALAIKGLDCAQGKLNISGTPDTFSFSTKQDVASDVGADQALAVQASSANYAIVLVGCRVGRLLVLFSFLRAKTTSTSALPNPLTVTVKGITKIKSS